MAQTESRTGVISEMTEAGARDFAEECRTLFSQAAARAGRLRFQLVMGPLHIALEFAGPGLVDKILPAFSHLLQATDREADLTLCFWDSATTGVNMRPPPWPADAYGNRGYIDGFNTARIYTFYLPGIHILRTFDAKNGVGVLWVAEPEDVPYWESSFPCREFLHWAFRHTTLQPLHAGAVAVNGKGVLLAGKSGSGKSTTCLACLDRGMDYLGDDYVLVDSKRVRPTVHSMYASGKLVSGGITQFPRLEPLIVNPRQLDREKALIYFGNSHQAQLIAGAPLACILLPTVTGKAFSAVEPSTAHAALAALAPTTLKHLPRANREVLAKMKRLVAMIPVYRFHLGTDLDEVVDAVRAFGEKL